MIALGLNYATRSFLAISGGAIVAFVVANGIISVRTIQAQTRSAPNVKFEAASIKHCTDPLVGEGEGRSRR